LAGKIIVVGSFVYDLIVWLPYFSRKGETLLASDFRMYAGGKDFNQAVAARRAGAQVGMIDKVRADQFGDTFLQLLRREAIDHSFVIRDAATNTSLGIPMIDPQGDNSIIGVSRANTLLTTQEVGRGSEFIAQHTMLQIQLEVPLESSLEAARIAHQVGLMVILNPAPATFPLSSLLIQDASGRPMIDWLIPNEMKAEMLSVLPVKSTEQAIKWGQMILTQGVSQGVAITLGTNGVIAVTHTTQLHVPAFQVPTVDPTGAGGAFCGAFAVALSEGMRLEQALSFTSAAGALAATVARAEPSLPQQAKIGAFLRNKT
jgi:ribokinase